MTCVPALRTQLYLIAVTFVGTVARLASYHITHVFFDRSINHESGVGGLEGFSAVRFTKLESRAEFPSWRLREKTHF